MDTLKYAVYILSVLSALIIVHEWGHFFMAKLCKMRVEDFSLFFGKRLISLGVRNGTEYNIRSIPLGGFVKIAGMEPDDASNGWPVYKLKDGKKGRILRGLHEYAFADVNLANVSDDLKLTAEQAIGPDNYLSLQGRENLQAVLLGGDLNGNERRYVEVILQSDTERASPDGFNQKPLWQRALVIFAGPFMSLFFGYAMFCAMGSTFGLPVLDRYDAIENLAAGQPAEKAGLKINDRILAVNGAPVTDLKSLITPIQNSPNKPIKLVIQREKQTMAFTVTPYAAQVEDMDVNGKTITDAAGKPKMKTIGRLGFNPGYAWERYSPLESVRRGTYLITTEVKGTFIALFGPHASDNVGGLIAIGAQIKHDSDQGLRQVLFTGASLSISIGLLNLFPIPILDGGHLMLLAIEGVRRRKLSSREIYAAQMVGISIIAPLFIWVMYHDIRRLTGR